MATLLPKTISYKPITGSFVNGVWTPVEGASSTFQGSVQPVTGKDLEALEVGREDRGKVKIYSSTPLNVSQAGTNKPGDIVIWDNREWEIISEMAYQNDLIEHYKYIGEFRKETS